MPRLLLLLYALAPFAPAADYTALDRYIAAPDTRLLLIRVYLCSSVARIAFWENSIGGLRSFLSQHRS